MQITKKKTLAAVSVIMAAALVAVAAAGFVPAALAQGDGISSNDGNGNFAFKYAKSGGIAGLQKEITYDSSDNRRLTVKDSIAGDKERTLSRQEEAALRDMIVKSGFFDLPREFRPNSGAADYFSYSLRVELGSSGSNNGGRSHAVSWVDPFASATGKIPAALTDISARIEQLASAQPAQQQGGRGEEQQQQQHPSIGKKRIIGTLVVQSSPHNAEGHSSHQAAYLLYPQGGRYVYSGTLTFSSTKPIDLMVYHDVTGSAGAINGTKGLAIHEVDGRSYVVTTLLKNATSGTVAGFAGSAVLAHMADGSEPYTIVATVDALRKTVNVVSSSTDGSSNNTYKAFTVEVAGGERFTVRVTDKETIRQMTDSLKGGSNNNTAMHVTGRLARGDGGFNQPWSWHLVPSSVRMAEVSIELCDGRPSMVEEDLDYWLGTVGTFCPWSSKVIGVKN